MGQSERSSSPQVDGLAEDTANGSEASSEDSQEFFDALENLTLETNSGDTDSGDTNSEDANDHIAAHTAMISIRDIKLGLSPSFRRLTIEGMVRVEARAHIHAGNIFGPLISVSLFDRLRRTGGCVYSQDVSSIRLREKSTISESEEDNTKPYHEAFWTELRFDGETCGSVVLGYDIGDGKVAERLFHIWDGWAYCSRSRGQLAGKVRYKYNHWDETQSDICFPSSGNMWSGEEWTDDVFNDGILISHGLRVAARHHDLIQVRV